jgi:hypothetical protein
MGTPIPSVRACGVSTISPGGAIPASEQGYQVRLLVRRSTIPDTTGR